MPHYLICYDICDPRRLSRLHRHLKRRALALQYSVFLLLAERRAVDILMMELTDLIDEKVDDLRCYRLPGRGFAVRLGAAVLPEGIQLTTLPASLHPSSLHAVGRSRKDDVPESEVRRDAASGATPRSCGPSSGARLIGRASSTRRVTRRPRPLRRRGVYRL